MKKHFNERETKTNITQQESEVVLAEEENDSGEEREEDIASQETNEDRNEALQEPNNSQREDRSTVIQSASKKTIKKRKVTSSQPTAAAQLMDYLIAKNDKQLSTATESNNAVDAFLVGITPALKSLSALDFHFAKSEIFSVVQKYELKALEEQSVQGSNYNNNAQAAQQQPHSPSVESSNMDANRSSNFQALQNCFRNFK